MRAVKGLSRYTAQMFIILAVLFVFCSCSDKEPKIGGNYTLTLNSAPENLDPQMASDNASFNIIRNTFATLVDIDDNGIVVPGAAQKYEISEDGLLYTFTLREGIVWKGKGSKEKPPLTADDYIFAIKRIYDDTTCSPYKYLFSQIENIDLIGNGSAGIYAKNARTLCIRLTAPDCDFLKKLAHPAASPCNEKLFLSTQGRYGLSAEDTYSCGAFYISEWNYDPYWTNNHVTLTRIKENSSEGYVTYPESVDMLIKPGSETDIYLSPVQIPTKKGHNVKEYVTSTATLIFNTERKFADTDVQKAVFDYITRSGLLGNEYSENIACGYSPPCITSVDMAAGADTFSSVSFDSDPHALIAPHLEYDKLDYQVILISSEYSSPDLAFAISDKLEELEYYSTVAVCEPDEFERRFAERDFDLCIYPVKAEYNSLNSFYERLIAAAGISSPDALVYLGSMTDPSAKIGLARNFETDLYKARTALPLTYEKIYVVSDDDIYDHWYDPCTDTFFLKYMKGKA
ncbi:MAG: hypothetical protein II936_04620 [Oscillospiraceae bacterium]|nr:hypothetical protein [Oscillospiraceae bacterium]